MLASGSSDPAELFCVHSRLGQGTFGTVWLATERASSTSVAIKVLPLEASGGRGGHGGSSHSWLEALRAEIGCLRACNECDSIVRFYGSHVTPLLEAVWIRLRTGRSTADL